MDRRYDLMLCLTLTATVLHVCSSSAPVVGTAPNIWGWRGRNIRLQCDIQEEPFAVVWAKDTISHQRVTKARFYDGNFISREERFEINKDFSLAITDLKVADEGRYHCQVVLNDLENFSNSTLLTVTSLASKHDIQECVGMSQPHQSRCTYETSSNTPSINLTCVVSGFKPNISMMWTVESGKILNSVASQQKTLSDDTYERFETITVSAKEETWQTFMCTATGDSLKGNSTAEITILPISGIHDDLGFIIGLAFGVPVALVILFLVVGKFLQKYHPDYLPRKGCGWNPCWRRPQATERRSSRYPSSLSEEQVQQFKEELKEYYRVSRCKVTVDPLDFIERVNLDDIYTDLSLIDQSDMHKTPLSYEDILNNNGRLSKRLLIQGEGGVGKTTLCAKIAWDWCQGRVLQHVEMLLFIPLQDVTDDKSIGTIVNRYLSDSNAATHKQIDDYISKNPSKVLLVFDGLDEFRGKLDGKSSSEVIRILGFEQYKSCKVIVTTRPWRTDEFMEEKNLASAYTFISIEGFNKENLSTYIKRYFRSRARDGLAESLINFMEENDVIRLNMTPFPIYCAMLCLIWKDLTEERREEMQKLKTFAKIFKEMISFLQEHYASKMSKAVHYRDVNEHVKKAGQAIQDIGEIALNGLLARNFSFPEEQFSKCRDAMETCCKVGVLTIERDVISREHLRDVNISSSDMTRVSFPHNLFQEYIAGIHIENVFVNDLPRYRNLKQKILFRFQEFRFMLYFASALNNELGLDLIRGLIRYAKKNFCVDIAFECHTEEATKAVGEQWEKYILSSYMPEHTKSGIVFMIHCDQVKSLSIYDVNCGKTLSRDVAVGICSTSVLHKLMINNSHFHKDFYKIIREKASTCQIEDLKWSFNRSEEKLRNQVSMGEHLATWVCTMPSLSRFKAGCYYLPENFLPTAATLASSCQIEHLALSLWNSDDDSEYQSSMGSDLAEWVCALPRLTSFTVKCYDLSDEFFSRASDLAQSCKLDDIEINKKPLKKVLDDNQQYLTQRTTKAAFFDDNLESREDRFNIDKSFSLVITDLHVADEGLYDCQVVLKDLGSFENSTFFGFKPNISMLWAEEEDEQSLNSVISQQTILTLSDGTYERFETITVSAKHGIEQAFVCIATGDSLNGTSNVKINVLPTPGCDFIVEFRGHAEKFLESRRVFSSELNQQLAVDSKSPSSGRIQPCPSPDTTSSEASSPSEAASDELV
ncbi:uncharacterized protein [Diadema setosum]|uniref:uncharacterized protein n=1 Tax=Diadema setosum TaxID=31175 RepID=UPI003B3ABCCE